MFWVAQNFLFHAYACVKFHNYAHLAGSKGGKKDPEVPPPPPP